MSAISNVKEDGTLRLEKDNDDRIKILKGNMGWHADFDLHAGPGQGRRLLRRGSADDRRAHRLGRHARRLRRARRRHAGKVSDLAAYHSLHYSQSKLGHDTKKVDGAYSGYGLHDGPVPLRPLVKTHPETGRKSLLIGRHAHNIPGMDKTESERFLEGLVDFACQPPRTYHHDWTPGDAVVWDNRCLLHQATPWDMTQRRIMWHSRIAGDPQSEAART